MGVTRASAAMARTANLVPNLPLQALYGRRLGWARAAPKRGFAPGRLSAFVKIRIYRISFPHLTLLPTTANPPNQTRTPPDES